MGRTREEGEEGFDLQLDIALLSSLSHMEAWTCSREESKNKTVNGKQQTQAS